MNGEIFSKTYNYIWFFLTFLALSCRLGHTKVTVWAQRSYFIETNRATGGEMTTGSASIVFVATYTLAATPWEEGTLLYEQYMYVPPQRVGFFASFWSENRYRLCPFWSGIGYGFRGGHGRV